MDVFTLYGNIVINDKEVNRSLDGVDSKVKETGGTFSKIGGGIIAGFGIAIGQSILDNVVGALKSAITMGWNFNTTMEDSITSFSTMLGSVEKAKKLMKDIQDMASKTPFETKDLTSASKTLMGFGVQAKDLVKTMTMLGDLSQGNSQAMQSLALVFGQVKASGKAMTQDIYQLINTGFAPMEGIAKRLKIPLSEVKDAIEKGKVSFQVLNDVMVTATSSGGMFYKSMENASKTMTGQWSTLKDNIGSTFGKILEPVFNKVSTVILPALNNAFAGSGEKIQMVFKGIGEVIDWIKINMLQPLQNWIISITPLVSEMFNNLLVIIRPIMIAILYIFNAVFPTIKEIVISAFNMIKGVLQGIIEIFRGILNVLAGIIQGDWKKVWEGLGQGLRGVADIVTSIFKAMTNTIISAINAIIRAINKVSSAVSWVSGGKIGTINIPTIPMLAKGGNIASSGMAIVGEAGPEMLNLPKGASVTPLNGNNASGIIININNPKLFNQNDVDSMMIPVLKRLRLQGVKGGI